MATSLTECTVLPPERSERLSVALASRRPGGPVLVGPNEERLELPPEVLEILRTVLETLSQGLAITMTPQRMVLSTHEAAEILKVSLPTLVRLLESGELPFEQPGRHRRIRLADALAYDERARRQRAAALDQMVADASAAGLYDLPDDVP